MHFPLEEEVRGAWMAFRHCFLLFVILGIGMFLGVTALAFFGLRHPGPDALAINYWRVQFWLKLSLVFWPFMIGITISLINRVLMQEDTDISTSILVHRNPFADYAARVTHQPTADGAVDSPEEIQAEQEATQSVQGQPVVSPYSQPVLRAATAVVAEDD